MKMLTRSMIDSMKKPRAAVQPSGGHIPVCPVSRRGGNPLLLYTISAAGQIAINISVLVRLMLLWPQAVSTKIVFRAAPVSRTPRPDLAAFFAAAMERRWDWRRKQVAV